MLILLKYFLDKDSWPPINIPLQIQEAYGIDKSTQILPDDPDLFVFDEEVVVVLEALVGKTLEQGLLEVSGNHLNCGAKIYLITSNKFQQNNDCKTVFPKLFSSEELFAEIHIFFLLKRTTPLRHQCSFHFMS